MYCVFKFWVTLIDRLGRTVVPLRLITVLFCCVMYWVELRHTLTENGVSKYADMENPPQNDEWRFCDLPTHRVGNALGLTRFIHA